MTDVGASIATTVSDPSPGWRTSEFWLSAATSTIGMLLSSGLIGDGTTTAKVLGFVAAGLATLGYTVTRVQLKVAHVRRAA